MAKTGTNTKTEHRIGSVVKLNSGGPAMTIVRVEEDGGVITRWFRGDNEQCSGSFRPECLFFCIRKGG